MYSGFEFNQEQKAPASMDYQQKQFNQGIKFGTHDHKHLFNFKAPPFEEPAEGFQIPSQILELFDSSHKGGADQKNKNPSRASVGSHSTLDSNRGPQPQSGNYGNQSTQNTGGDMSHNQNNMRYPSLNTLLNQSNDFMLMKNGDLNTSGISNKDNSISMSMNNLSRDSTLNTSTARRKGSMNAGKGSKNYQVNINEDISLIERIEILLNQITLNHNKNCPFCNKVIDIKKCNFQNISAFLSHTSKRYYLTHFDCYLKSNSNPSASKIVPLTGVVEARVNSQLNPLPSLDTSNFLRSDRRAYFVSIEGYHPISSFLLFRIDKIAHGLEHASHRNQLLYLNLGNKTSSIFEPSSYAIPFGEFRMVVTIHMSHANEDPYTYEYLLDFSQVKVSAEQKTKFAEVVCQQEGNSLSISTQISYDPDSSLGQASKINADTSFQSTTSTSSTTAKPDFNKNVFVSFKYFSIGLPLRRVEQRTKQPSAATAPIGSQNTFLAAENPPLNRQGSQQSTPGSKKPHARLQLNPHAPLFSAPGQQPQESSSQPQGSQGQSQGHFPPGMKASGQQQQQSQGQFFPSQQGQGFSQEHQGQGHFQDFGGFNQGQRQMGGQQSQMQHQQQYFQPSQPEMMPPGLGLTGGHGMLNFGGGGFGGQQRGGYQGFEGGSGQEGQNFDNYGKDIGHSTNILKLDNQFEECNQPQFPTGQEEGQEGGYAGEYPQEMSYNKDDQIPRGRGNRPANLYTAVLSGRKREDSLSNSPSLHNMQNKYFSATSTPRSAHGFDDDTPLSQNTPNLFGEDPTPLSDEMIENFKLEDHIGSISDFAKTYNGSRILQKFFPKASANDVALVISEIEPNLEELMLDPYANYMFQTLAQSCSADQRYFLLKKIAPSMTEVSCDRKGTHALQSLIALVSRDSEEQLLRDTLKDHIVELSFDPQGTHLIQKLITSISMNNMDFIFEPIVQRFVEVANHSFGLCVLKQLMTKVDKSPELKKRMIKLLHDNLENLIQNPYGNYALQHSLDTFGNDCSGLYEKTFERIVQYSNQKFSSNVIEKCLVVASPEYKKRYVRELSRNDRIVELMKNKYGNFVLLKALKSVSGEERQVIMQSISKNLNQVTMPKYKSSWTKFIEENPLRVQGLNAPKPSIFRNNSGQSEGSGADKKVMREEKSQFNKESNREGMPELGGNAGDFDKGMRGGFTGGQNEFDDESRNLKENIVEGRGPQQGGKKTVKGANQKFYDDKGQHYQGNKWGFNNFY